MIVDDSLTWEDHTDYITLKINRGISIIRRVRQLIPEKALLLLYQTLIDPYFRYCSTVWGQCGETLKDKLQALQNRAARSIANVTYEDADHLQLLLKFGWLSVHNLISYEMGVFMYKTLNGLASDNMLEMFEKQADIHQYSTRPANVGGIFIPHRNLSKLQEAISYAGARVWMVGFMCCWSALRTAAGRWVWPLRVYRCVLLLHISVHCSVLGALLVGVGLCGCRCFSVWLVFPLWGGPWGCSVDMEHLSDLMHI